MWKWNIADKECGIKSGQTNHMKNHTILWTHLDWTMFNQGSMLLWMYRAMNEKLASEHAYDAWWCKWYQQFGIGGWSAVKAYSQFLRKNIFAIRMLYFWKNYGSRMSEIMFQIANLTTCKFKKTNTKVHCYINTEYDEVPVRPHICYIIEKPLISGSPKACSQVIIAQIQQYKNTNIRIHK